MKHISYQGLDICIETDQGSYRHWYDPFTASNGSTFMQNPYGFFCGTLGTDGDEVDVYVGPSPLAPSVFVITQMRGPEFVEVDEQKVMLGFDSEAEAKAAYLTHYNNPAFFGSIKQYTIADFKKKLFSNPGKLIKHLFLNKQSASIPTAIGANMSTPKEIFKALTSRLASTKSGKPVSIDAAAISNETTVDVDVATAIKQPQSMEPFRNGKPVVSVWPEAEKVNMQMFKSCIACGHVNKSLDNCRHCADLAKQSEPTLPIWRR